MYHNQETAYHDNLNDAKINKAISLHPVKDPAYMFRLHSHFLSIKLLEFHHRRQTSNGILSMTKKIISGEVVPEFLARRPRNADFYSRASASSKLEWEYILSNNGFTATEMLDLKSTKSSLNERNGVRDAVTKILQELSENYRRTLKPKQKSEIRLEAIRYGYFRINPKYGVQYQFDLSLKFPSSPGIPTNTTYWAKIDRAFSTIQGRIESVTRRTLNIVVPLREKYDKIRILLARLKKAFLTDVEPIAVHIVYFQKSSGKTRHLQHINEIKKEFPEKTFRWLAIPGEFNRAEAFQKATKHLGNNSLLFFSAVHLVFRKEFVYRCRANTIENKQVYMPFIFRQYNRDIAYFNSSKPETSFVYTKSAGRWPTNEYGPVCIYGSDVMAVGGLNTAIKGWGMQDRDFTDRILRHGLSTFRALDKGIVYF